MIDLDPKSRVLTIQAGILGFEWRNPILTGGTRGTPPKPGFWGRKNRLHESEAPTAQGSFFGNLGFLGILGRQKGPPESTPGKKKAYLTPKYSLLRYPRDGPEFGKSGSPDRSQNPKIGISGNRQNRRFREPQNRDVGVVPGWPHGMNQ